MSNVSIISKVFGLNSDGYVYNSDEDISDDDDDEDEEEEEVVNTNTKRHVPMEMNDEFTVKSRFNEYINSLIKSKDHYYSAWDLDVVVRDWKQWMYESDWVNIYIIANDCENFDTHTHIGSVSDVNKRMKQHNGEVPGGPQDTKRAAGFWELAFYMKIPPLRNFSCKEIVKKYDTYRGLSSRCENLLLFALDIRAEFKISSSIIDKKSKYYCENIESILREHITDDSKFESVII